MSASPARRTRVFLCDDSPDLRLLLKFALSEHADLQVVGEAADGAAGIAAVAELRPDVVLLDLAMPVMDGLEALPHLVALDDVRIIVLTGYAHDPTAARALALGASRYISKSASLDDIAAAVRAVAAEPATSPE
jgi:DNA-binding NarL/FixJ family response regulator